MSEGLLQFSLGLNAGTFLSAMSSASGAVKGFLASTFSMGAVAASVWNQVEKGANLRDLSKRTGETVANLSLLQGAFKSAGVSAETLPTALFQLNKALGGTSDMGESTKEVFAGMGLSLEQLGRMEGPERLKTVLDSLAEFNRSDAALAAGKIFGRGNAQDMLQLARSTEEFAHALGSGAGKAQMYQESARAFDELEKGMGRLQHKLDAVWLGMASGFAPVVNDMVTWLNKNIDFTGIGKKFSDVVHGFELSVAQGKFGELMGLGLEVGFEKAINYFAKGMAATIAALPRMVQAGLTNNSAMANTVIGAGFGLLGKLGIPGVSELAKGMQSVHQDMAGMQFQESVKQTIASIKSGMAASRIEIFGPETGNKFDALLKDILSKSPAMVADALAGTKSLNLPDTLKADKSKQLAGPDVNALERVGLMVLGGGSNDYARQTADNTRKLVEMAAKRPEFNFAGYAMTREFSLENL